MSEKNDLRKEPGLAGELSALSLSRVYPDSIVSCRGITCALGRRETGKFIVVRDAEGRGRTPEGFRGETAGRRELKVGPASAENMRALMDFLAFLKPVPDDGRVSVGFGDRLGLATPGQVRALAGKNVFACLAQQSIREMTRTGRTADEVMTDAARGVFEAGFTAGFGADADHLKTEEDVALCARAGFILFTIDPGDHVCNEADTMPEKDLRDTLEKMEFHAWPGDLDGLRRKYENRSVTLGKGEKITFSEEVLLRALVKYGGAIDRVMIMAECIRREAGKNPFQVEISVDETESPTSPAEHFLVASELAEAGVEWLSLAPRFPGRFEKGVDYIGDMAEFESIFASHRAIARKLGDYKLSIHSGSDKFSIYPLTARFCGSRVHLKTAGTSYLEALRAVSRVEPELFREIYRFARERYETDRATYHVSASLERIPEAEALDRERMSAALDQFDSRQMFHVTFGSVLTEKGPDGRHLFRERLLRSLSESEEEHYRCLSTYLEKHVRPFVEKETEKAS